MRTIEKAKADLEKCRENLAKSKAVAEQARGAAEQAMRRFNTAALEVTVAEEVLKALEEEPDDPDG